MLLFLSQAWGEITIEHTLHDHYLEGQPIVFDLRLFNDGTQTEILPDISTDRSKIQFVLQTGTEQLKIQSEVGTANSIELKPRQLQEIQLSLPNSTALKTGTHQLSIQLNLNNTVQISHEFEIVTPNISSIDLSTLSEDHGLDNPDVLWQQHYNAQSNILFKNLQNPQYIGVIDKINNTTQSIGSTSQNHIYSIQNNNVYMQSVSGRHVSSRSRAIPIPWPNAIIFERGITDSQNRLHLPTWAPTKDDWGTFYMTILDHQQMPTFRKVQQCSKAIHSDSAITQTNIPLLLIHHRDAVDLFVFTETGDPKIDKLPPQSHRLKTLTANSNILDSQFGISKDKGLVAYILSESIVESDKAASTKEWLLEIFSIQGTLISATKLSPVSNGTYHSSILNQEIAILTKANESNSQWQLWQNQQWQNLELPQNAKPYLSIDEDTVSLYHFEKSLQQYQFKATESKEP